VSNRIPEQNLFKYMMGDYHPWQQWGRMRGWKDWRIRGRRRQAYKHGVRQAIQLEQSAIGDWREILSDPLHMIVDIYYDYVDSLYPDSDY